LRATLGDALAGVTTTARENSPVAGVQETADALQSLQADAVIAIRGGSAVVTSRAAAIVVAEQSRAFLDVVTDGQVRWSGPLSHVAACLDGVAAGERPVLQGDVRRRAAIAVLGYLAAASVTPKPVKVSLPGPATFVRLSDDRYYHDPARALRAVALALAEEVQALAEAGCRWFQLDEPLLTDAPGEAEACATVFSAAPADAVTVLSLGAADPRPLRDRLAGLPGTHLGLDATEAASLELLVELPAQRGVALGVFDALSEEVEDVDAVAARLLPWRGLLDVRDVLVGPNAGLAALARDVAFQKLLHARYLVEQLRLSWTVSASRR
jgi:5-methyltetrahydropteroyltriglutamate--homocysteine methyltransferase